MKFVSLRGASQLYMKYDIDGNVILIIAKVTGDILIACDLESMRCLSRQMYKSFGPRKTTIHVTIFYNGFKIHPECDGVITMDMSMFLEEILLLQI